MPAFNGQVQDLQGNAVTDFQVEVRDESSGNLTPIYSDKELTTPLGNPFTPNPLDNGYFRFYAANGTYRIRAFNDDGDVADWRDVPVGDDVAALAEEFLDEDANLGDVVDPETAFDNIKQPATDGATGVVEKATAAEVRSAAADKYIDAALLESASALVTLSESGGAVAVDWDAFINGTVTIDENSTISNPTNGQPGTWRTIYVIGNDTTDRTVSFGNQFKGELPAITDCDSTRAYLLMIYCVTSSHFVVSAKRALEP